MSHYFPSYLISRLENIKVELDLTNHATKTDMNNVTRVDTSNFVLKTNLNDLKTKVNKLDIVKLKVVTTDLAKLTKEVQEDFIKKKNRF